MSGRGHAVAENARSPSRVSSSPVAAGSPAIAARRINGGSPGTWTAPCRHGIGQRLVVSACHSASRRLEPTPHRNAKTRAWRRAASVDHRRYLCSPYFDRGWSSSLASNPHQPAALISLMAAGMSYTPTGNRPVLTAAAALTRQPSARPRWVIRFASYLIPHGPAGENRPSWPPRRRFFARPTTQTSRKLADCLNRRQLRRRGAHHPGRQGPTYVGDGGSPDPRNPRHRRRRVGQAGRPGMPAPMTPATQARHPSQAAVRPTPAAGQRHDGRAAGPAVLGELGQQQATRGHHVSTSLTELAVRAGHALTGGGFAAMNRA